MISWRPSQPKKLVSIWENYVDLTTTCEAIASGFQSVQNNKAIGELEKGMYIVYGESLGVACCYFCKSTPSIFHCLIN